MQTNSTPTDTSIISKPNDASDRSWQMFEGRYLRGIALKQLAKDFGVTTSAVSGACTLMYRKLVLRWGLTSDKSTIAQLTKLARPLTLPMWEALYFSAPEMFPGIRPTLRRIDPWPSYRTDPDDPGYFRPGQYDARDFANAFTPELGSGERPKWRRDPEPVDKTAIRLQEGVERIARVIARQSEKLGVSEMEMIELTCRYLEGPPNPD